MLVWEGALPIKSSACDWERLQSLSQPPSALGLRLLDHVIVAEDETYSFAARGLWDELELEGLAPEPVARKRRR